MQGLCLIYLLFFARKRARKNNTKGVIYAIEVLGQGELRSNLPESNLPESGERSRCQLLLRSLAPLIFLSELSSMYVCAGSFLRPGRFIEVYTIRDLFQNTFCNTNKNKLNDCFSRPTFMIAA